MASEGETTTGHASVQGRNIRRREHFSSKLFGDPRPRGEKGKYIGQGSLVHLVSAEGGQEKTGRLSGGIFDLGPDASWTSGSRQPGRGQLDFLFENLPTILLFQGGGESTV